jgi:hypothetical protein
MDSVNRLVPNPFFSACDASILSKSSIEPLVEMPWACNIRAKAALARSNSS